MFKALKVIMIMTLVLNRILKTKSYNAKTNLMNGHLNSDFLLVPFFILQMTNRRCDSVCKSQVLLGTEISW